MMHSSFGRESDPTLGSIALRRYGSRRRYLRDLIKRLDRIPQILPLKYRRSARTRGDHCRNIVRIVTGLRYSPQQAAHRADLSTAAMFHDIGHGPYGHASERAINEWLGGGVFSNDRQSARCLYFHAGPATDSVPMFVTPPLSPVKHIAQTSAQAPVEGAWRTDGTEPAKSRLLELLDDLENTVGDSGDLERNGLVSVSRVRLVFPMPAGFLREQTAAVALDCLGRFGFDGSFSSLVDLSGAGSHLGRALASARAEVGRCRQMVTAIRRSDDWAHAATVEMCERVQMALGHGQRVAAERMVDVVSTIEVSDDD